MLLYQIHVRSWTDSHIFLPLKALSLLLANLVQILKEKKILHGLQRDILLPAINKTNGRNDLKVKVTSVRVDPRHQALQAGSGGRYSIWNVDTLSVSISGL